MSSLTLRLLHHSPPPPNWIKRKSIHNPPLPRKNKKFAFICEVISRNRGPKDQWKRGVNDGTEQFDNWSQTYSSHSSFQKKENSPWRTNKYLVRTRTNTDPQLCLSEDFLLFPHTHTLSSFSLSSFASFLCSLIWWAGSHWRVHNWIIFMKKTIQNLAVLLIWLKWQGMSSSIHLLLYRERCLMFCAGVYMWGRGWLIRRLCRHVCMCRARVVEAERFEIVTKNRVWSLQASTANEAKLWVNALNFWLRSYTK